jgi:hypothetical protein
LVGLDEVVERMQEPTRGEQLHALGGYLDEVVLRAAAELGGDLVEEGGPVVNRHAGGLELDVGMFLVECGEERGPLLLLLGRAEVDERQGPGAARVLAARVGSAAAREGSKAGQPQRAGAGDLEQAAPRHRSRECCPARPELLVASVG